VVDFFMALLSCEDSTPRAYRLKVSNAALPFSTINGTSPGINLKRDIHESHPTCPKVG
jgi:hypothetical protein